MTWRMPFSDGVTSSPVKKSAQREAWGCVSRGVAAAGGIQFTCFEDKPETAIPIQIEVMR